MNHLYDPWGVGNVSPNMVSMTMPTFWDLHDIARYANVTYNSARTYHGRAEINRIHGANPVPTCKGCQRGEHTGPKPGDMPPPDARFGNSPVWRPETIIRWYTVNRPGRGVGGGRPRKSKAQEKA